MPQPEEQEVIEEEQPVVEEQIETEVLPPEEEAPESPQDAPEQAEPETPAEPSAKDLQARLDALEAENKAYREAQAKPPVTTRPGERVSMSQVYLQRHKPEHAKSYVAAKTDGEKFEVMHETVNQMLGAVVSDRVDPLVAATVSMFTELEIRDLRADPAFKALEPQVRKALERTTLKELTTMDEDGTGPVTRIYHQLRGKSNGTKPAPSKTPAGAAPAARKALADVAAGGGASPKAQGAIRLTKDQEADYQALLKDGIGLSRTEYMAKLRSRQDQAKAAGKPIPQTYR